MTAGAAVAAAATSASYCSAAAGVANTSTTTPRSRAPWTAFGPSARKSRRSERTERRLSLRASLTRGFPTVSGTWSGGLGRVAVLGERVLGGLYEGREGARALARPAAPVTAA